MVVVSSAKYHLILSDLHFKLNLLLILRKASRLAKNFEQCGKQKHAAIAKKVNS